MLKVLSVWWPALVVLAVLSAFIIYGKIEARDAVKAQEVAQKLKDLQALNDARAEDAKTRSRQNEIIVRDISPAEFDRVLSNNQF